MRRMRLAVVTVAVLAGCRMAPEAAPQSTPPQSTPPQAAAPQEAAPDTTAQPSAHNSRNSLDWEGAYAGTIPCADCPGIRMRIELRGDGTFERALTYLERNVAPVADTGSFEWDSAGAKITLAAAGSEPQQYQVGENVLFLLDRNGQRITGERAALYRLDKIVNDPSVENIRWWLIELDGRAVAPPADREGAYFELDAAQARATGNASCNRFSGPYELTAGGRLRFGPNLISTRMACDDLEQERELFDVLQRAEHYALSDDVLSLSGASTGTLARFRAGD
ncbi:MAG TPA: copper resistance protein NlpE N-terminal domain-containing protein [Gammaproteobacteria bacterium]|nr:copper resistance protein NlpE N-terminal domain-containing protein [Gammaproteobacteria bacterium]